MKPSVGEIETNHDQRKYKVANNYLEADVVLGHITLGAQAHDMSGHATEQEGALRDDGGKPEVAADEETQEANEAQGGASTPESYPTVWTECSLPVLNARVQLADRTVYTDPPHGLTLSLSGSPTPALSTSSRWNGSTCHCVRENSSIWSVA